MEKCYCNNYLKLSVILFIHINLDSGIVILYKITINKHYNINLKQVIVNIWL